MELGCFEGDGRSAEDDFGGRSRTSLSPELHVAYLVPWHRLCVSKRCIYMSMCPRMSHYCEAGKLYCSCKTRGRGGSRCLGRNTSDGAP